MVKRHRILIVFLLALLILQICAVPAHAVIRPVYGDTGKVYPSTDVYITDTGSKYHRHGCPYLKSIHRLSLHAAEVRGYEPCSLCRPDLYTGEYVSNGDGESGDSSSRDSHPSDSPPAASKPPNKSKSSGISVLSVLKWIVLTPLCIFAFVYYGLFIFWMIVAMFSNFISFLKDTFHKHTKHK